MIVRPQMQLDLIRLRYVEATGADPGNLTTGGIYGLSPVARVVEEADSDALPTVGMPKESGGDLCVPLKRLSRPYRGAVGRWRTVSDSTIPTRWSAQYVTASGSS